MIICAITVFIECCECDAELFDENASIELATLIKKGDSKKITNYINEAYENEKWYPSDDDVVCEKCHKKSKGKKAKKGGLR